MLGMSLWGKYFIMAQVYTVEHNERYQDNRAITIVSGLLTYNLGHNPRNAKNQKPPNYFVR